MKKTMILKTLVGSRGYGVFDEDSDFDYSGVFVVPTQDILRLGQPPRATHWIEDKEKGKDETFYEIAHFLQLALKCNPTILNVLKAPVVEEDPVFGVELRGMFFDFIDMNQFYNAFVGYGVNQRKKMVENKDNRWSKYGAAYARQLIYLRQMIIEGDYDYVLSCPDEKRTIKDIRNGVLSPGEILDYCNVLKTGIDGLLGMEGSEKRKEIFEAMTTQNTKKINTFLLNIRKRFWNDGEEID